MTHAQQTEAIRQLQLENQKLAAVLQTLVNSFAKIAENQCAAETAIKRLQDSVLQIIAAVKELQQGGCAVPQDEGPYGPPGELN